MLLQLQVFRCLGSLSPSHRDAQHICLWWHCILSWLVNQFFYLSRFQEDQGVVSYQELRNGVLSDWCCLLYCNQTWCLCLVGNTKVFLLGNRVYSQDPPSYSRSLWRCMFTRIAMLGPISKISEKLCNLLCFVRVLRPYFVSQSTLLSSLSHCLYRSVWLDCKGLLSPWWMHSWPFYIQELRLRN